MKKAFCDICGEPASEMQLNYSLDYDLNDVKLLSDDKAKVYISANFRFKNHSTGFGGPPDLCNKCIDKLLFNLYLKYEKILIKNKDTKVVSKIRRKK